MVKLKLHVWRGRDVWLARCPALGFGSTGPTRHEALRQIRAEVDRDAEMIFGAGIEVVEGPPPPMEDER